MMCRTQALLMFLITAGRVSLSERLQTTETTATSDFFASSLEEFEDYSSSAYPHPSTDSTGSGEEYSTGLFTPNYGNRNSICQTVPDIVRSLRINQTGGQIYAEWEDSLNPECSRYNISILGKSSIQENVTSVLVGNADDIRCTSFSITPLDRQNRSGETVTKTIPGQVLDLQVTAENHIITLKWQPPEDSTCVVRYVIRLGAGAYYTENTEYNIMNLEACTKHSGTVSAISETDDEGEPFEFSSTTTTPAKPGPVTHLTLAVDGEILNATWSPPDKMGACITKYNINFWNQDNIPQSDSTEVPYYVIQRVVPCMQYTFQVIALITSQITSNDVQSNITIGAVATTAPRVQTVSVGKTTFNVVVQVEAYASNMCKITDIGVDCVFSGEEFFEWMIKDPPNATIAYTDSGSSRPPATVPVTGLSEYTNYTCNVYVTNSGGVSEGTEFEKRTLEDVPSQPQNLKWDEKEDYVSISWDPPYKIPGELGEYQISINHTTFLHYVACDVEPVDMPTNYTSDLEIDFNKPSPNSVYVVNVAAFTIDFGESAEITKTTLPKESKRPRDVSYKIDNPAGEDYKVTVTLTWQIPCNTNGHLSKFKCTLYGESLENDKPTDETHEVDPHADLEDHQYSTSFNLRPSYNYTAKIFALTKTNDPGVDIQGETEQVSFESPDGYPSAPWNLNVVDITATSAVIKWEEPLNKNGQLTQYWILIQSLGALHPVPEGCENDKTTSEFAVDPNETQYSFTGHPNYNYIISMKASTSAGNGSTTDPIQFNTNVADPETVRDVIRSEHVPQEEIYSTTLTVSFKPPCNINDIFGHYEVFLEGSRDDLHSSETKNLTSFDVNEVEFSLKPEHMYTGYVRVHTEKSISMKSTINTYISPSGVPRTNITSLLEVEVLDQYTANFVLERHTFDPSAGKIKYYAIILSPLDETPTQETFGFWNNVWPEVGFWSGSGPLKTYQATGENWQPFQENDQSTYTFEIGTETCGNEKTYCNGQLRPDTEYHLRVRGFTSKAYRDTFPVKFITPSKLNLGALIGGLIGACILLIILFGAGFLFWRRRRKEKAVEEIGPLANPVMPGPVPIKAFVDHYKDYKTNLSKLKSEYTLLERKSAEQQSSTSFALTDDNKRKNRYTNILPYDDTRVKLDTDKNDNYSDYINASYIKGYCDNVEYIATQGPLEATVVDFWRMVIQENVSLIVMVAQFVELDKPKCHKYFPNNHETMEIGDGIEVRCATELPFNSYIKRTILVQRDLKQLTITHLQFTEWPDFGCPSNTDSMLEFCYAARQIIEQYKSKTIIHCSAGVGRTGTLIAIDILLQTVENNGDLDVFKTVLDLRKQRIRMVQTEKQYMFIYSCLAQHIQNPKIPDDEILSPIYENVTRTPNGGTAESAL